MQTEAKEKSRQQKGKNLEWVGIKLNKRKKKRKKIPKKPNKIFCKECKLLYISVQGGEGHRQTHTHTRDWDPNVK